MKSNTITIERLGEVVAVYINHQKVLIKERCKVISCMQEQVGDVSLYSLTFTSEEELCS